MTVVVEDQGLSVAIGKNGQNARLTSKLTGWKITVMSHSELMAKKAEAREKESEVRELKGVGEKLAENLIAKGFGSVEDLAEAAPEELTEIEGIGEKKAAKLIQTARELLGEKKAAQESSPEGQSEAEVTEAEEHEEKSEEDSKK